MHRNAPLGELVAAKLDGDNTVDLGVAGEGRWKVFHGTGARTFSYFAEYDAGEGTQSIFSTEGDGVVDTEDNCPTTPNVGQADLDNDETGDACDIDMDNDDVPNGPDVCDYTPPGATVQPNGTLLSDLDGDCDVVLEDYAIMQLEFTGFGS